MLTDRIKRNLALLVLAVAVFAVSLTVLAPAAFNRFYRREAQPQSVFNPSIVPNAKALDVVKAREPPPLPFKAFYEQDPKALEVEKARVDLADGEVLFITGGHAVRYRAADGAVTEYPVAASMDAPALQATGNGIVLVGGRRPGKGRNQPETGSDGVALLREDGRVISAKLAVPRVAPAVARVANDAVLVVGGASRIDYEGSRIKKVERTTAVELIEVRDDQLVVSQLPDLPGPKRRGFSLVALADGDALAMGGTESQYSACFGCLRNVWRFDAKQRIWREVAPMSIGRSEFSATLLADGRVLVAGGWAGEKQDADASVEVFDPRTESWDKFPSMPAPVAGHMAHWMAGERGRTLLIGGGTNPQIQALDVEHRIWRTAGEMIRYRIGAQLVSYLDAERRPWVAAFGGIYFPRGQNPSRDGTVERIALRGGGVSLADRKDLALGRYWTAAFAVSPSGRVLIAGGATDGDPGAVATASVDMLAGDPPALSALPALNHARILGVAGWLSESTAVVAGGQVFGYGSFQAPSPKLPIETFDANTGQWRIVTSETGAAIGIPADAAVGIVPGSGVLVATDDGVTRYAIRGGQATSESLPALLHARRNSLVRVFDDGRIVIAGGTVQADRIAVVHSDSGSEPEDDQYEGTGPFLPARTYDIFEPSTKRWRESVPSKATGAAVAILDDGRVVCAGELEGKQRADDSSGPSRLLIEISDAAGTKWAALPTPEGVNPSAHSVELFSQQGEILLKAERGDRGTLFWYDRKANTWSEFHNWLHWNSNAGTLIIVTTGNGKRIVWVWPSRAS